MPHPAVARRSRLAAFTALQPRVSANDPLAISAIKTWPLREPASGRRYTVVRLETVSRMRGYGECRVAPPREVEAVRRAIIGQPASAAEILWQRMGDAPNLRAAINMAQLDLFAQAAKAPLYQVLGGPTRNKARALAPLDGAAALERAQNAGFRAFATPAPAHEFRNAGKSYVSAVATLMNRLRNAAGDGNDFVLDAAAALTPGDAQSLAAELESFHMLWFDEPCPLSNLGAIRKIASENVTPLGFGRRIPAPGGFQDLLREDAVDILRPDLATHGITAIRRIAALAEVYYIAVAPYHDGGPIATAAALHLAASIPNFFIQQVPFPADPRDREMRQQIAAVEAVKDGFLDLPNQPGLGIQVKESVLDKYQEAA
ncbi:MAG: mandelate racemase/muconate lactonizing enzyme family protein [Bryobacteraceae bacterium]